MRPARLFWQIIFSFTLFTILVSCDSKRDIQVEVSNQGSLTVRGVQVTFDNSTFEYGELSPGIYAVNHSVPLPSKGSAVVVWTDVNDKSQSATVAIPDIRNVTRLNALVFEFGATGVVLRLRKLTN